MSHGTFLHLLILTTFLLLPFEGYCKCTVIFVPVYIRCTSVRVERVGKLASGTSSHEGSVSIVPSAGWQSRRHSCMTCGCRLSAWPIKGRGEGGHRLKYREARDLSSEPVWPSDKELGW